MRTRAAIERELVAIADELEYLARRQEELFARRLSIWLEAREDDGGREHLKHSEMAAPSRVTKGAVTQALRKYDMRNGARA